MSNVSGGYQFRVSHPTAGSAGGASAQRIAGEFDAEKVTDTNRSALEERSLSIMKILGQEYAVTKFTADRLGAFVDENGNALEGHDIQVQQDYQDPKGFFARLWASVFGMGNEVQADLSGSIKMAEHPESRLDCPEPKEE